MMINAIDINSLNDHVCNIFRWHSLSFLKFLCSFFMKFQLKIFKKRQSLSCHNVLPRNAYLLQDSLVTI